MGLDGLRNREFDAATAYFDEASKIKAAGTEKRIQKFRLLRACSLYEAGKQYREEGDWGAAKRCFGAAKKTKALPTVLKQKNHAYLEECGDKCDDIDDIELDDCTTIKIEGNAAFELYKQAKRAMAQGDSNQAGLLFEAARQHDDMPKELKKRTKRYIKELRKHKGEDATACVFSDNCTHILGAATGTAAVTLSMSDATFGIATSTLSTAQVSRNREMLMVLQKQFPPNSKERSSLVLQLKLDIRKALDRLRAEIRVLKLDKGSVIVRFQFVSEDAEQVYKMEDGYLQQVGGISSAWLICRSGGGGGAGGSCWGFDVTNVAPKCVKACVHDRM
jgi:hypothetical protein